MVDLWTNGGWVGLERREVAWVTFAYMTVSRFVLDKVSQRRHHRNLILKDRWVREGWEMQDFQAKRNVSESRKLRQGKQDLGTRNLAWLCIQNDGWCTVGPSCFQMNDGKHKGMAPAVGGWGGRQVKVCEDFGMHGQGGWFLSHGQWGPHCIFWKRIKCSQLYELENIRNTFLLLWNRSRQLCNGPDKRGSGDEEKGKDSRTTCRKEFKGEERLGRVKERWRPQAVTNLLRQWFATYHPEHSTFDPVSYICAHRKQNFRPAYTLPCVTT